jgi:ribonuclease T1
VQFVLALLFACSLLPGPAYGRGDVPPTPSQTQRDSSPEIAIGELPREARHTLALINKGGPFPYERDGVVFGNFEKRLPIRERGYYREYTVPTPGVRHRGARRIVAGRAGERYYTDDHYQSFRRIVP